MVISLATKGHQPPRTQRLRLRRRQPRQHGLVPAVVTGLRYATLSGLCQSFLVDVPVLGTADAAPAGGDRPAEASDMFIDATTRTARGANFSGLDIGVAQGAIAKDPVDSGDRASRFFDPDGVGQRAVSATLSTCVLIWDL
ncbi:DUF6230 family protein [Streptomyces sp. NPDC002078]